MNSSFTKSFGLALVTVGLASQARAHFLWAELPNGGPRRLTLTFAEKPGEDVLPIMGRLAAKTQVYVEKTAPVVVQPEALNYTPERPASAMLVYLPYGVIDRGGKVYGLDYYAKAVVAPTDAAQVIGKGFEIVATLEGDNWKVSAYKDGKVAIDAEVVIGEDGKETKSALGQPLLLPIGETPTSMPVRAVREVKRAGDADGKHFETTKEWTSLALPPVSRVSKGSDPLAYRALESAVESRETMRSGGAGWNVDFKATNGQDALNGTATWPGKGLPALAFGGQENSYTKHVSGQLSSLFMHRMSRNFWEGDGASVITWTDDTNALGRKILVADRFNSSYRLKDGRIRQVVRTIGKETLTLDITEIKETGNGRYLTTRFLSESHDAKSGELADKLEYWDTFKFENGEWLPAQRKLQGTAHGSQIMMAVEFGPFRKLDDSVKITEKSSGR